MQPRWFEAGAKEYIFPTTTLLGIEFLTLGALELKRYQGWKKTGTVSSRTKRCVRSLQWIILAIPKGWHALCLCSLASSTIFLSTRSTSTQRPTRSRR